MASSGLLRCARNDERAACPGHCEELATKQSRTPVRRTPVHARQRLGPALCPAPMRLAFMGTPDFAVPTLDALLAAGHEVVAVYSQPPRPAGRGKALRPSPVHQRAHGAGIEVRTPSTLRDPAEQEAFAA